MWNKFLDWFRHTFFSRELQCCLVGLGGAGKTTLTNALVGDPDHDNTIPTIGFNVRNVKKGKVDLHLWDLGGQAKFRNLWERYCNDAQCIVFVVDATAKDSLGQAKEEIFKLLEMQTLIGKPLLVLGNKCDLDGALDVDQLTKILDLSNITEREVCVYSISAKEKQNLEVVLKWMTKYSK